MAGVKMLAWIGLLAAQEPMAVFMHQTPPSSEVAASERMVLAEYLQEVLNTGTMKPEETRIALHTLAGLYLAESKDRYFQSLIAYDAAFEACFNTPGCTEYPLAPPLDPMFDRVLAINQRLLTEFPGDPERDLSLYQSAWVLEWQEKTREAEPYFRELGEHFPDSAFAQSAWLALGDQDFQQQQLVEAVAWYQLALKGGGKGAQYGQYKLAWSYFNLGEEEKALEFLGELGKGQDELGREARRDAVMFLALQNQGPEAIIWVETHFPEEAPLLLTKLVGRLEELGEWDKAADLLDALRVHWPEHSAAPGWGAERAQLYARAGQKEQATALYRQVIEEAPASIEAGDAWYRLVKQASAAVGNEAVVGWSPEETTLLEVLALREKLTFDMKRERYAYRLLTELLKRKEQAGDTRACRMLKREIKQSERKLRKNP
jgi:tetratricopeptide (TPR) repeat protein